jgi:hypothetical protein
MATTTATITLASSDLLSDPISFSTTTELTQAGNATGLTGTAGLARKTVAGGHASAEYFLITVNSEDVGRLYAGDWAFFPWSAHDNDCDIKIDPSANDMTLEYMLLTDE